MRKKSQISIRDIARELGLNISTVSRALNRSYRVSKETTEMVLRKAHEMGYHFQKINKNIVILLPSRKVELAWYSINMINALQGRLKDTDYLWEFINEDNIRIIQERSVSGIISLEFTQHIAQKSVTNIIFHLSVSTTHQVLLITCTPLTLMQKMQSDWLSNAYMSTVIETSLSSAPAMDLLQEKKGSQHWRKV